MIQIIISFVAGALTVLAPCVLPLLPVVLAGSVTDTANRRRPLIIVASLSISVFLFTLLLKGSTALLSVSPTFWSYVSAIILAFFGLTLVYPEFWAKIVLKIPGHSVADKIVMRGSGSTNSYWSEVLIGAALGPVFTTCSPTFFVILATILPQNLGIGIINILAYIVGLAIVLLLVATLGRRIIDKLAWASDPYGLFRRILGVVFILLGVSIALGFDKKIETAILDAGFFDVTKVERAFTDYLTRPDTDQSVATQSQIRNSVEVTDFRAGVPYTELVGIADYINTPPLKLADLVGKKVILVDFIDYTCINCQRTFPYLADWYRSYKDQGLEIVAIHTPEFSFEKDKDVVEKGVAQFGLKFPIVLDNDYATWNAYGNRYWPHKYLIDIHGNVVYDHIGEGEYAETERLIVEALNERKNILKEQGSIEAGTTAPPTPIQAKSPETYMGAARNQNFGNGRSFVVGQDTFTVPSILYPDKFYLGGTWAIDREYARPISENAQLSFVFNAAKMYIVAQSPDGTVAKATVMIDGRPISATESGVDVVDGILRIDGSRLYQIYNSQSADKHRIDIIFSKPNVRVFTFTFG